MTDKESERTTDFHDIKPDDLKEKPFPGKTKEEFRVHFTKDAYKDMMDHAGQTDEVELGGVLIGDMFRDSQGPYLDIIGSVPAEGSNNYGAQITFTHESWNHINKIKDEKYPDSRIVGWYHTHPGFGVFLSSMDSFIQENFFNEPFQVAVVIETKSKSEGCFAWINGKPKALERYWCGEKEIRLETGSAKPFHDPDDEREAPRTSRLSHPPKEDGCGLGAVTTRSVLTWLLLCLFGFLIGQWSAVSKTANITRMVAEAETAAAFEYAGLSTMMADDLRFLDSNLEQSLSSLDNNDAAKAREFLLDSQTWAAKRLKEYEDRESLRHRIREVLQYRGFLGLRMEEIEKQQSVLGKYLAEVYLSQLMSSLDLLGKDYQDKMNREMKMTLKLYIDRIIQLDPSLKSSLQRQYPELMDVLYPPSKKQRQEEMK
ncbi:Mov34/MPN/PAD-1 family protein [Candidatus Sumerlaeota bacterium]|nr:Mov34/MPN/PAD-1 family protein [Candidatus Sumerlaeota bacterium]